MKNQRDISWFSRGLSAAAAGGFERAFRQIRVDPEKYLRRVRREYRLPIQSWQDMFLLGPEILNPIARRTISSASKMAGMEGMGLGLGGFLTLVPDMGILSAITLRMLQKLSLLYGFEYATEDENIGLWIAAASAAGLDLGRDFVEKQAVERLVPRIVDRIAVKVGTEVAEKWAGRIVPLVGAGAAGAINFYFVRSWGRRAQKHFLARHYSVISQGRLPGGRAWSQLLPSASTP
jgi:uncharacterized protein (DUF697 family)